MGGYPNEMYQQQLPTKLYVPIQKEIIEQKPKDKFKFIVNTIGDTIGWGWIFSSFVIGAVVILTVIFKAHIKRIAGEWLKWADQWVNKE